MVVAAGMTVFGIGQATAAIVSAFSSTFSTNTNGSIILRGNASLTCPTSGTCTNAKNKIGTGQDLNDNGYAMINVDVDDVGGTFNSSTSDLTVPAGSTVLFAGLYWGADTTAGSSGSAAPNAAIKNTVKFKAPGGAYTNVTSTDTSAAVSGSGAYQGYADVTQTVAGAGNGTYTVANIQAGLGVDRYAGWSLVVAYSNPSEPMRNLVVYDGFGVVRAAPSTDSTLTIPVGGFETPPSGPVNTTLGAVVYEGDLGNTGDQFMLDSTVLHDANNDTNNFFNSSESDLGSSVTTRNPSSPNMLGVDIDRVDASGILANGAHSAELTMTTGGETFYPGVLTFSTDLYAPKLVGTKTSTDVNGGNLTPGDQVEYTIAVTNQGTDGSTDSALIDAVPDGMTYVDGSMTVDGVGVSDTVGDDRGEFRTDTAQGQATFRIGTGATASVGGRLAVAATTTVTFRATVDPTTPGSFTALNIATMAYDGESTGLVLSTFSNANSQSVVAPTADLRVTATASPALVQRGGPDDAVSYDITVVNNGPDTEPAAVVTLTLTTGVTAGSLPAGCTAAGQVVTCALGALAVGSTETRRIDVTVDATVPASTVAHAETSGAAVDAVTANNEADAQVTVNGAPSVDDDAASTTNGVATTVTVLGNDSDTDGDPLRVSAVSAAGHGTVTIDASGSVTYLPELGFAGDDTFTYTADDGRGGSTVGTVTITVDNASPITWNDQAGTEPSTPVVLTVLDNDVDPNGDALTVTGTTQPGGGAGTVVFDASTVTFTPAGGFSGTASFTYTVSDGNGGTDTATVFVVVGNAAPTAVDDAITTPYLTDVVVPVVTNDTDPNGDTLTVTTVGTPVDDQGDAQGSATDNGDGTVTYQPPAGFSGVVTFDYEVTDGADTATATVIVTVQNGAPVADTESVPTGYASAVTIPVLTGDTDPNGDPLAVVGVGNPAHGVVQVNNDGTVTYTPQDGWSGADSFTYTVGDGHGGTATATVTVTVANAPPVAVNDARVVEVNTAIHIPVLLNDTDPNTAAVLAISDVDAVSTAGGTVTVDGNRLLYTPPNDYLGADTFTYEVSDGTATDTATVTISVANTPPAAAADAGFTATNTPVVLAVLDNDTDPSGDAMTVTGFTNGGAGLVTVNGNGTITYTPAQIFSGTDTFTYTVGDGRGGFDTTLVTVTVLNAPPVAVADAFTAQPGVATELPVLVNDTDANHQPLLVVGATYPGKGSLAKNPDDSVRVNPDGSITYTPLANATGTDTFSYTVSDGNGGTSTATVTVALNAAPLGVDDSTSTTTGTAKIIDVLGNDIDAEDDTLTVFNYSQPSHGGTVLNGNQTITYTPDAGYFGADTFAYTVEDAVGNTSTATVTITVTNGAPTAVADAISTGGDDHVDIDVLANDTDPNTGQTLTATLLDGPDHGTVEDLGDGVIRYTPDSGYKGTDTFTYTADDGNGGTDVGTVTVTVSDLAPVAVADADTTTHNAPVSIAVLDNDTDGNGDPLTVIAVSVPQDSGGVTRGTVTIDDGDEAVTYDPPLHFAGTVTFTYTMTGGGASDTATVTVTVANAAPVAVVDEPGIAAGVATDIDVLANDTDVNTGQTLTVTAFTQPLHGVVTLNGDGTLNYDPDDGYKGPDTFTYTVSDGHSGTAQGTVNLTVSDAAPVASADSDTTPYQQPVVITVLGNDMDPNDDPLTVTDVTDPQDAGGVQRGEVTIGVDGKLTYEPSDGFSGVVTFTYTIDDGDGGTDTALVTVTVGPAPAVPDESVDAEPGEPVEITLPTVDEHGNAVTVSAVADPAHGTAVVVGGKIVYSPDPGFSGTDTFQYTMTDAFGNTASAFITVTVAAPTQVAPVAKNNTATTKYGKSVVITVLSGDTDADGDLLTVQSVTQPNHGTVSINADGTVSYTPDTRFSGKDTFTYTITDGNGNTDTASVTVTVAKAAAVVTTPADDTDDDTETVSSPGKLPKTGTDVMSMAGAGLAVLIAGAALVWFGVRGGSLVRVPVGTRRHRRR
jgi:uncharacterized repeat protein (TIGR01451 family)/LPXTG-motif cell wall-anchored protein